MWSRIDKLTGADPLLDFEHAVKSRTAFTYSVVLAAMGWLNAFMLHASGEGRPGMVWIGILAGAVALGCGAIGVITRRPNLTMGLIFVFAVLLFIPSVWGNRGSLPPSTIYVPGIMLGFYLVWGVRSLIVVVPPIVIMLVSILRLGTEYGDTATTPLAALVYAVGFACLWVVFIGSLFRSASTKAQAEILRSNAALEDALDAVRSSSRAKSEFLANMGHEIRTPLNGVLGMTKVMLDEGDLTEQQVRRLRLIDESGQTLLDLLNDLLDLSKIDSGHVELDLQAFDAEALTRDLAEFWRPQAEAKGLTLTTRTEFGAPLWLQGDTLRMRQILNNLLGNAVKFTRLGGITLDVSAAPVADGERTALRIAVTDTGPGIPADRQESIFEPFSQVDTSTTREYGGTGLGLAICRKLAGSMGGTIDLASDPGQGSSFTLNLILPRTDEPEHEPSVTDEPALTLDAGVRILVVDDVATNQVVLRALLQQAVDSATLEVECAGSAREAINKAAAQDYDLILMDIQMPEMDGVSAMRSIRQNPRSADSRIIAVTAMASPESKDMLLADGFSDYLAKPIDATSLRRVLKACLAA